MKITKVNKNEKAFSEVKAAECVMHDYWGLIMRVAPVIVDKTDRVYNAVSLDDGAMRSIDAGEVVLNVNAEVVIMD